MRTKIFALICAVAVITGFKGIKKETYKVNTDASSVEWVGKKVTGEHKGAIRVKEGNLIMDDNRLTGGSLVIDMNSMTCTDMQGEWGDKLVGHLKADDFFGTEKNPTATFVIKSVTPLNKDKKKEEVSEGKSTHTITGDLTIKGITNEISFPALIETRDNAVVAIGDVNVDRTKFGIKYGSKSFVEGIGDKAINDDFNIKFKIAAKK